jgi:hypothetical protein
MTHRAEVTVRFPGVSMAPVRRTFTCCHTGVEHTGAQMAMPLTTGVGSERLIILS